MWEDMARPPRGMVGEISDLGGVSRGLCNATSSGTVKILAGSRDWRLLPRGCPPPWLAERGEMERIPPVVNHQGQVQRNGRSEGVPASQLLPRPRQGPPALAVSITPRQGSDLSVTSQPEELDMDWE